MVKYFVGALTYPFFALVYWIKDFVDRMHDRGALLEEYDCFPWEKEKIRKKLVEEVDRLIFNQYYSEVELDRRNVRPKVPEKKPHLTVIKGDNSDE